MDNPEKLATYGKQQLDEENQNKNTMCWTPLYAKKLKQRK